MRGRHIAAIGHKMGSPMRPKGVGDDLSVNENDTSSDKITESADPAEVLVHVKNEIRKRLSMDAEQRALQEGVDEKVIITWIDKELYEEKSCMSIPFIIVLLALFVVMVNSHLSHSEVRGVEQAISLYLSSVPSFGYAAGDRVVGHKTMRDIYTISDMYSWFNQGLAPVINQDEYSVSETIRASIPSGTKIQQKNFSSPSPVHGDFLRYNTIIGGLRFQQRVTSQTECNLPDSFQPHFASPCYESSLYLQPPENFNWLPLPAEESAQAEYFMLTESRATWLEHLRDMEIGCKQREVTGGTCTCLTCGDYPWVDLSSLKAEVTFVAINRELGAWSLININFFFNRGGKVWHFLNVESQWIDAYARGWHLLAQEICWFLLNMIILCQETFEIYRETRLAGSWKHFPRVLVHYFKDLWNVIDSITIFIAFCLLGMWILHMGRSAKVIDSFPDDYANLSNKTDLEEFLRSMQEIFILEYYVRVLFSLYSLVIMMRLFKGFAAQPRLALVTRTLQRAGIDLVHFLFVFVTIFAAFGAAGLSMFGREMEEFSTFALSINSLYRILLGDFLWQNMAVVGTFTAALFFWLYTVIVVLLMLNMLLAVILESYANVKQEVGNAETLWSQVAETFGRWRAKRRKERVGLNVAREWILKSSARNISGKRNSCLGASRKLTLEDLMSIVPGLKESEGTEILTASLQDEFWKREHLNTSSECEIESLDDVVTILTQHQAALNRRSVLALDSMLTEMRTVTDELRSRGVLASSTDSGQARDIQKQPLKLAPSPRISLDERIELLERSFSGIAARLDTVDLVPLKVRDLTPQVDLDEREAVTDAGCVNLLISGCKPVAGNPPASTSIQRI